MGKTIEITWLVTEYISKVKKETWYYKLLRLNKAIQMTHDSGWLKCDDIDVYAEFDTRTLFTHSSAKGGKSVSI